MRERLGIGAILPVRLGRRQLVSERRQLVPPVGPHLPHIRLLQRVAPLIRQFVGELALTKGGWSNPLKVLATAFSSRFGWTRSGLSTAT